jgi:hypothetical protein
MKRLLAGTAACAGLLALSTLSASAALVCSGNICWHAHETYQYPAESRVVIHEDSWKPGPEVTIREHDGRGYWSGDRWVTW